MEHVRIVSRWHRFLDGVELVPPKFYASLDRAIERRKIPGAKTSRVAITEHGVRGENGALDSDRICVRVQREGLTVDVCAAPFGSGSFVSMWTTRATRRGVVALIALLAVVVGVPLVLGAFAFLARSFGPFLGGAWTLVFVLLGAAILVYQVRQGFLRIETEVRALPVLGSIYDGVFRPAMHYGKDEEESFSKAVEAAVLETVEGLPALHRGTGLARENGHSRSELVPELVP